MGCDEVEVGQPVGVLGPGNGGIGVLILHYRAIRIKIEEGGFGGILNGPLGSQENSWGWFRVCRDKSKNPRTKK